MTGEYVWDPGEANPKQKLFFASRKLYTAYGGAKGGGKTWAVRTKALLGAYNYAGIRILILRRTYPELQSNHIEPMLRMINPEFCSYNGSLHSISFSNGSLIHFGHWAGENSELEYNGQEYDWIFLDEATQFTWRAFQFLGGLLRGVNDFPKRMYITCNPGGVGHRWVKRLFIDRDFITDADYPEASEDPEDYVFIPATVEDNTALLRSSPAYVRMLSSMPEDLRRAYRYGDWEALGGSYFPELAGGANIVEPFKLPDSWKRYRAFDYGLDMFACAWFAVDGEGRSWMYREFSAPGLIVREAAEAMLSHTLPGERIEVTFAPSDMWNRQKDTGRTMAEIFMDCGVPIVKADNNRVQGHLLIKEALARRGEERPMLMFFKSCRNTIEDLRDIQADETNPNDCAREPHDVTHRVDAVRYYCISRTLAAESAAPAPSREDDGEPLEPYDEFMTGGSPNRGYLEF